MAWQKLKKALGAEDDLVRAPHRVGGKVTNAAGELEGVFDDSHGIDCFGNNNGITMLIYPVITN